MRNDESEMIIANIFNLTQKDTFSCDTLFSVPQSFKYYGYRCWVSGWVGLCLVPDSDKDSSGLFTQTFRFNILSKFSLHICFFLRSSIIRCRLNMKKVRFVQAK